MKQKIALVESYLLLFLGVGMIAIMFINSLGRYTINSSFMWAEEVIRILFVWAMFVAITDLFIREGHIGFDVVAKLNRITRVCYEVITNVVLIIFGGNLVYFGMQIVNTIGNVPLPATKLPNYIFFLPGVIAGVVWVGIGIVEILRIPNKMKGAAKQ